MFGLFKSKVKPPKISPENLGIEHAVKVAYARGKRTWKESFDLVKCLSKALKENEIGHKTFNSFIVVSEDIVLQPQIVSVDPIEQGGAKITTTIEISSKSKMKFNKNSVFFVAFYIYGLLFNMAHAGTHDYSDYQEHFIAIDKYGDFLDPADYRKKNQNPEEHLGEIVKAIKELDPNQKILIFVHGGLNKYQDSLNRVKEILDNEEMKEENYYPFFVIWHSSLLTTYKEHLLWVRQGQRRGWSPLTSPFVLAADLGQGLVRAQCQEVNGLLEVKSKSKISYINFYVIN